MVQNSQPLSRECARFRPVPTRLEVTWWTQIWYIAFAYIHTAAFVPLRFAYASKCRLEKFFENVVVSLLRALSVL